jgi:CRISPR/Cas system-associated exonuclease Cas4 (RecB family)
MRLYRVCQEIEKAVERDVFVPSISGESCTYCDYADGPCPVTIPSVAELREQEAAWL